MKKNISRRDEIKHRHAIKRWQLEVDRKEKGRRRLGANVQPLLWGNKVMAPPILSVYSPEESSFTATVDFINYIQNSYEPSKDIIDFSSTEETTAAALTLLYSVLERATFGYDGEVGFVRSESRKVNAHLRRSNVLKLLRNSDIKYVLEKAESIPVISSVDAEYADDVCEFIKYRYFKEEWSEDEVAQREWILGSAIHETVDNVRLHAYPDYDNNDKKWWLSCDVIDDTIYLAIYDLGVGIPNTVHEQEWFKGALKESRPAVYSELVTLTSSKSFLARVRNKLTDADLIFISMLDDYTGTGKEKHGQGSKSIKKLVNDTDNGILWVYSGNGLYKFRNESVEPELARLPSHIPGTLIQWNIKLP